MGQMGSAQGPVLDGRDGARSGMKWEVVEVREAGFGEHPIQFPELQPILVSTPFIFSSMDSWTSSSQKATLIPQYGSHQFWAE